MTPERWRQITKVLGPALELAPAERRAYLEEACADISLRQEVEALIAAHELRNASFLEAAAVTRDPLEKGRRLGDYRILAPIGAGGMGEVYRARDTRLNRDVAIKVLPALVSTDPDRLQRFELEARAAAALNHTNILTVFQMGTDDTLTFIVSELLDGSTLREQVKHGPLPLHKAIDFAIQIARGLAAAHEKGIVHRDLKPENLFVTRDGRVKILDFGLAKLTQDPGALLGNTHPAVTLTAPGAVLGTVGYMSPEQASGTVADRRSDIFAFGAVLYEMLSGTRAFQRPTPAETLTAILNDDPPALNLRSPAAPPALEKVVQRCLEKNPEQRFQSASDLAFALDALSASSGAPEPVIARPVSRRAWPWAAAAAVLVVFGIAAARYLAVQGAPALTEKDSIVLADFSNTARDPVFDGTLRQGLSVQLEQTPFLRLASADQIAQALRLMERPPDTRLTPEVAREVCQRAGATIDIEGSIALLGSQYVIGLTALNCQTGETVAQEQATATGKDTVLAALTTAASDLRSKLGESRPSLNKYGVPLEQATTASLPALQAYSRGAVEFNASRFPSAAEDFDRAVALDPNFAEAYALMGTAHAFMGEGNLATQDVTKAYALRDRVSEFERLFITANYYLWGTRDLERAVKADQIWAQTYPRDPRPWPHLAFVYRLLGRNDEALETGLTSLRLDPAAVPDYTTPMLVYMRQGRANDAMAIVREAQAHQAPGWPRFFYMLAFLRHDESGMAEQAARIGPQRFDLEGFTAAYNGQLARARESIRRAIAFAKQSHASNDAAGLQADAALLEAFFGNADAAGAAAVTAISPPTHQSALSVAALSLALADDAVQAQKIAADLTRQFPDDTFVQFYYLPSIRAALALDRGKPDQAIESLLATTYDLAVEESSAFVMVPVYLRGTAYLAARRGSEAAGEFQKILDRPGLMLNCPLGALARLGLGRAYVLQGDTARAKAAYQDFLTLWKDADPDLSVLKQAKSEYATLQ